MLFGALPFLIAVHSEQRNYLEYCQYFLIAVEIISDLEGSCDISTSEEAIFGTESSDNFEPVSNLPILGKIVKTVVYQLCNII